MRAWQPLAVLAVRGSGARRAVVNVHSDGDGFRRFRKRSLTLRGMKATGDSDAHWVLPLN
jgi:hypothetical protein